MIWKIILLGKGNNRPSKFLLPLVTRQVQNLLYNLPVNRPDFALRSTDIVL